MERKINLCGTLWTIKDCSQNYMKELQREAGDSFDEADDGRCEYNTQTIYVNNRLHDHRFSVALTHELLHVITDSVGLEKDEKLIRRIEHGVYELINNFPEEYKNK